MKYKKKLIKVLCFSFVFLTCLYSFYVPSYALDRTAFKLQAKLFRTDEGYDATMDQNVPMTQGVVYTVLVGDENQVDISAFCNVDTGSGYFTSGRFGAYYVSSNTDLYFNIRFYFSIGEFEFYPSDIQVTNRFDVDLNRIQMRNIIFFSDDSYVNISPALCFVGPRITEFSSEFNTYVTYQDINCSMDLKQQYPDKLIQRLKFIFFLPYQLNYDGLLQEYSYIKVSFLDFTLGEIVIDKGNLNEVQQAEQQGQQYQSSVQNMTGIGAVPDVNPIGLVQGSSDFMRWASHTYSIPVLSSMVAITLSFSILFFLLKKR